MKIFKYNVVNGHAVLPLGAKIIRCDHVDDGFYKGDFVWAIVDPIQPRTARVAVDLDKNEPIPMWVSPVRLQVKEKQTITCSTPLYAGERDGDLFVYVTNDEPREHQIAFFKTGQEIDVELDRLVYLGLNRLWIVQELGLYTFLVK